MNSIVKYKFVQDGDSHWYMILARDLNKFNEWMTNDVVRDVCSKEELIKMGIDPTINFEQWRCDPPQCYTFSFWERDR